MSNVSRGHDFEREVKEHFTDAGWGCTRAAHSASIMDLIAFQSMQTDSIFVSAYVIFESAGYKHTVSTSEKIPLRYLAVKVEKQNFKHVYWEVVLSDDWAVVLMQCKIKKR